MDTSECKHLNTFGSPLGPLMVSRRSSVLLLTAIALASSLLIGYSLVQMGSVQRFLSVDYKVFGRVQGVFFRKYTKDKADELGLFGWVRNERDGTVSGVVQGSEDKVNQMEDWLTHKGSPHSQIHKCDFTNRRQIDKVEFSSFSITR